MTSLDDLKRLAGLEPYRRYLDLKPNPDDTHKALCPFHADKNPSLIVYADGHHHCFACGAHGDALDLIQHLDGCDLPTAKQRLQECLGATRPPKPKPKPSPRGALRIFDESEPLQGTLGEAYLSARGLSSDGLKHAVRFHPDCPFGEGKYPAVVALMRDVVTDDPCGIHRTALTADAKKIERKMLGRAGGAAVKLTPDADATLGLGIAEGIETALSVMQSGWAPVWAALSAGSIKAFPVLPGIEHLTVWADHDPTGITAASECARRWAAANRGATVRYPEQTGNDFNDWRAA